ncbi:TetR/AcrR family transcriptional regulator [Clostridium pasteurianum]|uniref:Transcriptional regulator n=1 Tax=Clostridium pasteurianum BC1 TaxID=86416 RepID=R4K5U8_CLOPA|nr:TetR/AcrR family transcriptional regulator [Clostridium pasteurianum]AGK95919.1 transcriptional regulator [Clostridium pasteurianum BC1]
MEKRTKILLEAKKLFSEHGYNNVSMQCIAEACSISKASIYKLFESKNELLRKLLEYNIQQMLHEASTIDSKANMNDEEKFKAKIYYEIESYIENKELSKMLIFTSSSVDCTEIKKHIEFVRFTIMNWNKNNLLEYYGEDILNIVWDLTFILMGSVNMLAQIMIDNKSIVTTEQIVQEIKKNLDVLVKDKKNRPALFAEEKVNSKFNYRENKDIFEEDMIEKCLLDIADELNNLPDRDTRKKESLAALDHLSKELSKTTKAIYLVDSLLGYLNEIDNLKPIISKLKALGI